MGQQLRRRRLAIHPGSTGSIQPFHSSAGNGEFVSDGKDEACASSVVNGSPMSTNGAMIEGHSSMIEEIRKTFSGVSSCVAPPIPSGPLGNRQGNRLLGKRLLMIPEHSAEDIGGIYTNGSSKVVKLCIDELVPSSPPPPSATENSACEIWETSSVSEHYVNMETKMWGSISD